MFIESIDRWLLTNVFQKFSNWFQRLTGKDNFFLANVCIFMELTCSIIRSIYIKKDVRFIVITSDFVFAIIFFFTVKLIRMRHKQMSIKSMGMNPLAISPGSILMRVIGVVIVFTGIIKFFVDLKMHGGIPTDTLIKFVFEQAGSGFMVSAFYLIACTPLPPQKGKISEWLTNLGESLANRMSPVPEPV